MTQVPSSKLERIWLSGEERVDGEEKMIMKEQEQHNPRPDRIENVEQSDGVLCSSAVCERSGAAPR